MEALSQIEFRHLIMFPKQFPDATRAKPPVAVVGVVAGPVVAGRRGPGGGALARASAASGLC